jgi:hypothetical protein
MENIENIDIEIVRRRKHTVYESYRDYKIKTKYDLNYYHATKREINCPICDKKNI